MADDSTIIVEMVTQIAAEVIDAMNRLIPQLGGIVPIVTQERFTRIISCPCAHLFIARAPINENIIVGTLSLIVYPIPTGVHALIEDVVVDSEWRGRGIGEQLMRSAISLADQLAVGQVDLTSRPERESANA